eukprot:CAMPEP_0176313796 /NCGR_PEP_ID=MMETSP0121_2-20121125/67354_1 /TAXON_ID=160619 /ORGANISM="Kryptoperidinium foliaceum, Strain CCMP 1326" /LENGTH=60 /DNA_ID=CAMNT_0017655891 /DNA_START=45 /DNA_END=223 /DNA_ORIENTATION=+
MAPLRGASARRPGAVTVRHRRERRQAPVFCRLGSCEARGAAPALGGRGVIAAPTKMHACG